MRVVILLFFFYYFSKSLLFIKLWPLEDDMMCVRISPKL